MDTPRVMEIYNFRPVNAHLATSGQPTEEQLAALAQDGFEVIVNLSLHDNPRYSLPDEPGLVRTLGMQYVHIPVLFDAPTEADLLAFFTAMDTHRHRKVLIHCAANKRVTAFLGLHRVIRQGWPPEEAFALMRSVWEPDPVWSGFIAAMQEKHRG